MRHGKTQRSSSTWTPERRIQVGFACVLAVCVQFVPVFYFAVWNPTQCQTFEREAQITIKQLSNMVETYRLASANQYLPTTLDHLSTGENKLTEEVPMDPWGSDYVYLYTRIDQPAFVIFSRGPDGVAGTEDDIFEEGYR